MIDNNFYRAFEDRYRGSRDLVKSRMEIYLPFILPLKQFSGVCQGIDLGCGRGEWLELMQENEIDVHGVDLDQGMLEATREFGLNVIHGEAIQSLQLLAPESQLLVSGFHLAEHLPFDALQVLVRESLRVLKPGGLLILETPNPENIVVGTANFYLDPTHKRPIPWQLLSFVVEYSGFKKVKTLRLQEAIGIANNNALTLLSVLNDVSPDYAIVAQKEGAPELVAATASAFEVNYGISLENLANRFNQQFEAKAQHAEAVAQHVEAKAQHAEAKAQNAEAKAQNAEAKAQNAEAKAQNAEAKAQNAEAKAQNAEAKAQNAEAVAQQAQAVAQQAQAVAQHAEIALNAIYNSTSWRITAPLRMIGRMVKSLKQRPKLMLMHARLYINRRPKFRQMLFALMKPFPVLERCVKQAARAAAAAQISQPRSIELADLAPRVRRIYEEIKAARENYCKESS